MLLEIARILGNAYLNRPYRLTGLQAMEMDHAIGECVVSGGNRRSARMSIMNWADPDIVKFIQCKTDPSKHWTTNISMEVDENFFFALNNPDSYYHMRANELLALVAEGMLKNGEPGIWNAELSNEGENRWLRATNPCGEIALDEWEACNLGHLNLQSFCADGVFDLAAASKAARLMTRFLIRSTYGDMNDPKQKEIQDKNRRIGVGFFGYAGMCALLGVRYSASWHNIRIREILTSLKKVVDDTALEYAKLLRIPVPIKTTTVAPTGTTAKMPGATEAAHPIYSRFFLRRIRFSTIKPEEVRQFDELVAQGYEWEEALNEPNTRIVVIPTKESLVEEVEALGFNPNIVESADEISLPDMLSVQEMIQDLWADNAVSFTVNIDPDRYTANDLKAALREFLPELKGTTVFPDLSRPQSPYERITEAEYEALTGPKAVADSVNEECASGACPIR
jgi:adenosylcobalamin-dependent ribonucleoside-triphosphate reductase